ncbi:restriction endonuclease subunit S [Pantoea agglomerans]|uniref:restriction endonuclease subunit S n=1 Tax=Enterobacter agglomerans TaxID=549 RepID=UPI003C7AF455
MSKTMLPKEWINTNLGAILLSIIGGGTPSKSKPEYFLGNIPWMSVKDMNKHILKDTVDHITPEAVKNSSTNIIPAGTPIIATRMSLGKIVTASFDSAINQDLKALFLPKDIERNFFLHWYRSQSQLIESLGTGTTVKGIRLEVLNGLSINLPPLAEQKIIADKLDDLLARVESIKARLGNIPEILKTFRQSVLASAVNGNLTENWRGTYTPNIPCFESIAEKKRDLISSGQIKKDLVAEKIEPNFENVREWLYLKLQSLAEKITDGEHKTPKREKSGRYLLSARNIQNGFISVSNVDYVGEEEFKKLRKRCDPNRGDVLISCSGSVGRICLVDEDDKYVMVRSAALVRIRGEFIQEKYLMYFLQSPISQKHIEESSKSTAQANLFLGPIKDLVIALPSIDEQAEIVRRVEELFTFANSIEQKIEAALEEISNLTQSVLAKAFRGELTAQWREENPELISGINSAEALLERIAEEKLASGNTKRSAKKAVN